MKKILAALLISLSTFATTQVNEIKNLAKSPSEITPQVETAETAAEPNKLPKDFTFIDMEGNEVKLSDYKGKKILLAFWATWCPYCNAEAPELEKFHQENDDIVVLGVNVTNSEKNEDDIQKYIDKHQLTFTNIKTTEEQVIYYQAFSLPINYFVDEDGVLIHRLAGALSADQMKEIFTLIDQIPKNK